MTAPRAPRRLPAGIKHVLVEEPFDLAFSRPLADHLVEAALPTRITPNHLTLLAGAVGLVTGPLVARATPAALVLAVAALLGALVLDAADGMLARRRGGGTSFGRVMDGLGDGLLDLSLHLGMGALLAAHGAPLGPWSPAPWVAWTLAVAAGLSYAVHNALVDGRRQWFLAVMGLIRPPSEELPELRAALAAERRPIPRFLIAFYLAYVERTAGMGPAEGVPREPLADEADRRALEAASARLLRLTMIHGPSTQRAFAAVALLAAALDPRAVWAYVFVVLGPLNAYHAWLLAAWRDLDAALAGRRAAQ